MNGSILRPMGSTAASLKNSYRKIFQKKAVKLTKDPLKRHETPDSRTKSQDLEVPYDSLGSCILLLESYVLHLILLRLLYESKTVYTRL